jgi:hypothetical protein
MKVRKSMLIRKVIPSLLALALCAFAENSRAQTNLLPVTFNAICTSSNSTGLLPERVTNINLIDDCAFEHGLSNLDNLKLVFNTTNFSVQVLDTNGAPLCTSLAFSGGLTFTNTTTNITQTASNKTQIVFQRNVFVETNLTASGVISGNASWNGTNMSSFKLNGTLLYTEPANGTNAPEICHASLRVGENQSGDEDDDDDGGHPGTGNQGGNGNHLGWQNPHNPHSSH